jgi:hypothetical protein
MTVIRQSPGHIVGRLDKIMEINPLPDDLCIKAGPDVTVAEKKGHEYLLVPFYGKAGASIKFNHTSTADPTNVISPTQKKSDKPARHASHNPVASAPLIRFAVSSSNPGAGLLDQKLQQIPTAPPHPSLHSFSGPVS